MEKMSKLILGLAEQALAQPTEKSSREAVAAALLLTHVAWNRVVDPLGGDQVGQYRKVLRALEAENPKCLGELKSTDWEAIIQDLMKLKGIRYPTDDRIIRLCGLTAENTVRVEWHPLRDGGDQLMVADPVRRTRSSADLIRPQLDKPQQLGSEFVIF